jgi:hypothetical protein
MTSSCIQFKDLKVFNRIALWKLFNVVKYFWHVIEETDHDGTNFIVKINKLSFSFCTPVSPYLSNFIPETAQDKQRLAILNPQFRICSMQQGTRILTRFYFIVT